MLKNATVEITIGRFRNDTSWQRKKLKWSELIDNLEEGGKWFARTGEKYKEYLKLPRERQDEIKDVGGFVGGLITGGHRKKNAVLCRTLLTLDLDHMTPEEGAKLWKLFKLTYDCAAVLYSTHKHSPDNPRYRIIIPFDRKVEVEEYPAIARRVAGNLGIDMFDHTGFQIERMMFFPSCSKDGQYVFKVQDGDPLCADDVLDSYGIGPDDDLNARYDLTGWKDSSQWPMCSRETKVYLSSADVQGNPLEKPGIVGAFCRTFSIHDAIRVFLPTAYEAVEGDDRRYTYAHGSTSGGAIVYYDDEGNDVFIYSHHGTDPISERTVNAFDLVRLHKFGHLDTDEDLQKWDGKGKDTTKLESYKQMVEYALRRPEVRTLMGKEKREKGLQAFQGLLPAPGDRREDEHDREADRAAKARERGARGIDEDTEVEEKVPARRQRDIEDRAPADRQERDDAGDTDDGRESSALSPLEDADSEWVGSLDFEKKTGIPKSTISNVLIILENDPNFAGRLKWDSFRGRLIVKGRLPWRRVKEHTQQWEDDDSAALRHYLERVYQISGREKIEDAIRTLCTRNSFHPVKKMLQALEWDGKRRIDTLLIDYLGAEDNDYVRTVTRTMMVAAVTRIMRPGCKFDNVLTLVGEEGKMKSMLFDYLSYPWFSDSLTTVIGKEAFEAIRGYWFIELGELSALSRAESNQTKQFLSKRQDSYRAPWGRVMLDHPRSNIFVATTNEERFLKGIGGDRRFWPVYIDVVKPKYSVKSLEKDRELVGQLWAEAMEAFRDGEKLYLDEEMFYQARAVQEAHTVEDERSTVVREYLDMKLPKNWYELSTAERRAYVRGELPVNEKGAFVREKVIIREVWVECFGKMIGDLNRRDSDLIAHIMNHTKGWKRSKGAIRISGLPGTHRGWVRSHFDDE